MELKNIIWRCIPDTNGMYQISTAGTIRKINSFGEKLTFTNIAPIIYDEVIPEYKKKVVQRNFFFYLNVQYKIGKKVYYKPLTTLLYEVFYGISELDIDEVLYLDRNVENNILDNLVLCQKDEWRKLMLNISNFSFEHHNNISLLNKNIKFKYISVYNINGYRVGVYKNKNELLRHIKILPANLNAALNASAGYCENNFIYKYGYGPYLINTSQIIKNNLYCGEKLTRLKNKIVIQYTVSGKFVEAYNNIYEASAKTKIQAELIEKHLKNQYVFKDSIWIYG